jgi:hypothetical protein
MARTYADWMTRAANHKAELDQAIADRNIKDIIYYRGKYIYDLKNAHALNPTAVIPTAVSGRPPQRIEDAIRDELVRHQTHIDGAIKQNKRDASIKKHSISTEIGLKMRRVSTRIKQINFAQTPAAKKAAQKELVKDSIGLAGTTLIKAPVMATAKVASKVGPLAITIFMLPATIFASLLRITYDAYNGKASDPDTYNNTIVNQFSKALKDGVKAISTATYDNIGRI